MLSHLETTIMVPEKRQNICFGILYMMFGSKYSITEQLDQQYNRGDLNRFPKTLPCQIEAKSIDMFFYEFDNIWIGRI